MLQSSSGSARALTRGTRQLSVVVPCYNEHAVIPTLLERLVAACRASVGDSFEIVLVNDGSRDDTWQLIQDLSLQSPHVTGVDLSRNFGHQKALSAGLSVCGGDRVLVIDADLQDPPELVGEMMRLMDQGSDVVYGQRTKREGESLFKRFTAAAFYRLLARMTNVAIPVDTGDFRLMTRQVVDALLSLPEEHRFVRGLVAWLGFRQRPLAYVRNERYAGQTSYPLRKMVAFAADAITSFSIVPLRASSYLAFLALLMTGPIAGYVIYSWVFLGVVKGWASLALLVLFFSAAQLAVLGIMGEYIGRIYVQSKGRPLFLVREIASQAALLTQGDPGSSAQAVAKR